MKRPTQILALLLMPLVFFAQDTEDDPYMDAFVVIADTSQDYDELRDKMFVLAGIAQFEIDTLGRGYDKEKGIICLPDGHEDEIYAGHYFPRRFPSETLSIEYLGHYMDGKKATKGTFALVVAITDKPGAAISTLTEIRKYMDRPYILQASIFIGCAH